MNISERLKEERERLGLTQPTMGEIGGVKKVAQINYEKGERSPNADYLAAIAAAGADVQYILTGMRSTNAVSDDEAELLADHRSMDATGKRAVKALCKVYSKRKGENTDTSQTAKSSSGTVVSQSAVTNRGAMVGVGNVGNITYGESGVGNGTKGKGTRKG